jgi:N utilization substance protein A
MVRFNNLLGSKTSPADVPGGSTSPHPDRVQAPIEKFYWLEYFKTPIGERKLMKNEFALAFNEVLEEKQLPKEVVLEALEAAMVSAYRRAVNASNAQHVEAQIDTETGKVLIYAEKEVVDTVQDPRTEVSLTDARKVESEAQLGSMVVVETTPRNFGRVAAQTARQVIQQRIREAERDVQFEHYSKQQGEILSGIVQATSPAAVTLGLDMKAEGQMPRNQQIPGERFRVHDRVRALLLEVKLTPRGPQIILSRAHRNFLRRLLENEVPEIYQGMVEVRSIAREPGQRSKVAVSALQAGVDPVGACVGIRGVRIQAIVRELNDEKIDVIEWNSDPAAYIAKALSPARVAGVYLNEHAKGTKTATVVVPEDQLSLAIGRDGQNARLAAKLTSWRIDIKSLPEAATDALHRLQSDAAYAELAEKETEIVPQVEAVLAKKTEGRPVTPEEYQVLGQFVDRVERFMIHQRQAEKKEEEQRIEAARSNIPAAAFEISMEDFSVSDRVYAVISEAGFPTVGDLMIQMDTNPDAILKLSGMGPKGMKELEEGLEALRTELQAKEAELAAQAAGAEEISAEAEAIPAETEVIPAEEAVAVGAETMAAKAEAAQVEGQVVEEAKEAEVAMAEAEAKEAPVAQAEAVAAAVAEEAAEIEAVEEPVAESAEAVAEPVEKAEEQEEETSLEELFELKPEDIDLEELEFDDDEDIEKKSKKQKKKRYTQVEYDPDKDVMVVKKKRKRGGSEWDDDWSF